jgi:NADH dehydrogenase FAD-containing subunit
VRRADWCGEVQDVEAPSSATEAAIDEAEDLERKSGNLVACEDVFALGDCAGDVKGPLPALAQVCRSCSDVSFAYSKIASVTSLDVNNVLRCLPILWPGRYRAVSDSTSFCNAVQDLLTSTLVQVAEQQGKYLANTLNHMAIAGQKAMGAEPAFMYRHLGSMATIGKHSAVLEMGRSHSRFAMLRGLSAWFAWRSAYLTRLGSLKKRIEVASTWLLTIIFGRDTSRW